MSNPFGGMSKSTDKGSGNWLTRGTSIVEITDFSFRESQGDKAWIVKVEGTVQQNVVRYEHAKSPQKNTNPEGTPILVLYQLEGNPKKDSPKLGEIRQFIGAVLGVPLRDVSDDLALEFATACGKSSFVEAVAENGGSTVIEVTGVVSYSQDRTKEYVNARYGRDDAKLAAILSNEDFKPTIVAVE